MLYKWSPNEESEKSYYVQLAEHLYDMIRRGYLKNGEKLSERKLAELFGVSRSTVTRALNILREGDLIKSTPKSVTRIAKDAYTVSQNTINWRRIISRSRYADGKSIGAKMFQRNLDGYNQILTVGSFNDDEFKTFNFISAVLKDIHDTPMEKDKYIRMYARGIPDTRSAIVEHLSEYGIETDPALILTCTGINEAFNTVAHALFTSGTALFHAKHEIFTSFRLFSSAGAELIPVDYDNEGIRKDAFIDALKHYTHKNRLLFIQTTNQIPTGITMSERRITEILNICQEEKIPIIEYDVFRDVCITHAPRPFKARDTLGQVIYIGAPSLLCDIGSKTAWIAAPDSVFFRIAAIKMQFSGASNNMLDIITHRMLSKRIYHRHMESVRERLRERRGEVQESLLKYLGGKAKWNEDALALTIWLNFPHYFKPPWFEDGLVFPGSYFDHANDKYLMIGAMTATQDALKEYIRRCAEI